MQSIKCPLSHIQLNKTYIDYTVI